MKLNPSLNIESPLATAPLPFSAPASSNRVHPRNRLREEREALLKHLQSSDIFRSQVDSFTKATGLPLVLAKPSIAKAVHRSRGKLVRCWESPGLPHHLAPVPMAAAWSPEVEMSNTSELLLCPCFPTMELAVVAIRSGPDLIAWLLTGRLTEHSRNRTHFAEISSTLRKHLASEADVSQLHDAYFRGEPIKPGRYEGAIKMLGFLSTQISGHAEALSLATCGAQPRAILNALRLIHARLADRLPLPMVAQNAGLSESHFCRLFKEHTGLTMTEYVSRLRIAWAKRKLLRPSMRISEVAYAVGFQSLSQFNRSFGRLVGCSPSDYRAARLHGLQQEDRLSA